MDIGSLIRRALSYHVLKPLICSNKVKVGHAQARERELCLVRQTAVWCKDIKKIQKVGKGGSVGQRGVWVCGVAAAQEVRCQLRYFVSLLVC